MIDVEDGSGFLILIGKAWMERWAEVHTLQPPSGRDRPFHVADPRRWLLYTTNTPFRGQNLTE